MVVLEKGTTLQKLLVICRWKGACLWLIDKNECKNSIELKKNPKTLITKIVR